MRNPKPQHLWGITYSNSPEVMPDTIRRTRMEAQKSACDTTDGWRDEWKEWRDRGCRAVRVIVQAEGGQDGR
jgi:hypothetical protein